MREKKSLCLVVLTILCGYGRKREGKYVLNQRLLI
jgi:elongator complex protein 2